MTEPVDPRRLEFLLATNPGVIYSAEVAGDYAPTYVSPNLREVFGIDPAAFLDEPDSWVRRVHPDDRPRILTGLSALFDDDKHVHEYRFRNAADEWRWVRDEMRLIRAPDGSPTEVIGCMLDITERVMAERHRVTRDAEAAAMQRIAAAIGRGIHPGAVFELVAREAVDLLGFDIGGVVRFDDGHGRVLGGWARGGALVEPVGAIRLDGDTVLAQVHRTAGVARVEDYRTQDDTRSLRLARSGFIVGLGAPITLGGQVWGALACASRNPHREPADLDALASRLEQFAGLVAIAVATAEHAYFGAMLEAVQDGVWAADPDGTTIYVNDRCCEITGVSRSELIGRPWPPRAMSAQDRAIAERGLAEMRTHGHFEVDRTYRRPDGTQVQAATAGAVVRGPTGDVLGYVATIKDLTERIQTERELQDLYENAPCGYHSLDADGVYVRINNTQLRWLGYEREEIVGVKRFADLLTPEGLAVFEREFPAFMKRGWVRDVEFDLVRKDGSTFRVSVTATAIYGDDGEYVMSRSTLVDITERSRTEVALREAKELAELALARADMASQAKDAFLSRMSHELRTPLNAILGFGQLLQMDMLEGEQADSVDQILKAGQHLLELINEVLDISRIESGTLSLSLEPVDVGEVLREAIALVWPLLRERNLTLEQPARAGDCWVIADRQRLKQILLNLLSNAIKYNRDGGRVTITTDETADERVRIGIDDTGSGIAPSDLEKLFEPFERLGAEQTHPEGTGLGLALSRSLAEAMSGDIEVVTTLGQGSTFILDLPAASRLRDLQAPRPAERPALPYRPTGGEHLVLLVEDNLANVRLIERIVGQWPGVRLETAMQGRLALDLAARRAPDLVILDLHLPDIDGDVVLERLRGNPTTHATPVIVVSADATSGAAERLVAAGADAFVSKPFDVPQLLGLIADHLHLSEG